MKYILCVALALLFFQETTCALKQANYPQPYYYPSYTQPQTAYSSPYTTTTIQPQTQSTQTNQKLKSTAPTTLSSSVKTQPIAAATTVSKDEDYLPPPQLSFGFLGPLANLLGKIPSL